MNYHERFHAPSETLFAKFRKRSERAWRTRRRKYGASGSQVEKRTRCVHGHEFTKANTYVSPDGFRQCKLCRRIRQRQCVGASGLMLSGDGRRYGGRKAWETRRARYGSTGVSINGHVRLVEAALKTVQIRAVHKRIGVQSLAKSRAADRETLAQLKRQMLNAHPDRGGSTTAFIRARRTFLALKDATR